MLTNLCNRSKLGGPGKLALTAIIPATAPFGKYSGSLFQIDRFEYLLPLGSAVDVANTDLICVSANLAERFDRFDLRLIATSVPPACFPDD